MKEGEGHNFSKKVTIQQDLERNIDLKIEVGRETGTNAIVLVYESDFGHTCGKAKEPKMRQRE